MSHFHDAIKRLRESAKLSQQQVADGISMSRSSYSQLELGQRSLSAEELVALARFFECDESVILASPPLPTNKSPDKDDTYIMQQVILYMANKLADKPNFGETLLNKLLYFVDFDFYEWTGELMTGQEYIKQPFGPVPKKISTILDAMEAQGSIKRISTQRHGHVQKKVKAIAEPDMSVFEEIDKISRIPDYNYIPYTDLPLAKEFMDLIIEKFGDWTAQAVTKRSHEDEPYKLSVNFWDTLEPALAFYRDEAYISNYHNLEDDPSDD